MSLDSTTFEGEACDLDCNLSDLAVWIDPIDATSQYIKGGEGYEEGGLPIKGLPVVTVLLGAFLKSSGLPVLGVVNQPFAAGGGSYHWAVKTSGGNLSKIRQQGNSLQDEAGFILPPFFHLQTPGFLLFSWSAPQSLHNFWKGL